MELKGPLDLDDLRCSTKDTTTLCRVVRDSWGISVSEPFTLENPSCPGSNSWGLTGRSGLRVFFERSP